MVIEAQAAKRELKLQVDTLREESYYLMQRATKCEASEIRIRDIAEAEGYGADELVDMVKNNEQTLDLLRANLREKVTEEVVRIVLRNGSTIINEGTAKSLSREIAVKLEEMGVLFDEEKFIQALAANPTLVGAITTVKILLTDQYYNREKDGVHDMFHLSNEGQMSRGSAHAARASLEGKQVSLAQRLTKGVRQHRGSGDEKSTTTADGEDLERPKNPVKDALHQFWIMAMPYFREDRQGRCLFGILIVITLVNNALNVYFSYMVRDFYNALTEKHVAQFYKVFARYVASMIVGVPIQVSYRYMYTKIGIAWRKWLTEVSYIPLYRDHTFSPFSFCIHKLIMMPSFSYTYSESSHSTFPIGSSTDLKRKEITPIDRQGTTQSEVKRLITLINVYKKMCQALHPTAFRSSSLL
jgi:hypothetical protein